MKLAEYKIQYTAVVLVLIVCFSVIMIFALAKKTNIIVEASSNLELNTINVTGKGRVFAEPDIAIINLSLSETNMDPVIAQQTVENNINKIIKELVNKGVEKKDIKTTRITIVSEYQNRVYKGQESSMSLQITLRKLDDSGINVAETIGQILKINDKVEIRSVRFDLEDKTEQYSKARELAYKKAEQKASELAKLGDVNVIKPISISDDVERGYYGINLQQNTYDFDQSLNVEENIAEMKDFVRGQVEVVVNLDVSFAIN